MVTMEHTGSISQVTCAKVDITTPDCWAGFPSQSWSGRLQPLSAYVSPLGRIGLTGLGELEGALHLAVYSLKSVRQLLEEVFDYALVVVAPAEDVVESGEAVRLAALLLMIELFGIELVGAHHAPVVIGHIHRETRRQRPVDTDDHGVLAGPAIPGEVIALHKADHLPEPSI